MANDPAFLFYPNDFTSGTRFFTDEQIGKYIRLLCAQFDCGHLKESHMINICKTYDKDVFSKFEKDSDGLFFNKRLEDETIKRKKYSESRRNNRLPKNNICSSYVPHMENENENIVISSTNSISTAEFFEKLKIDLKSQQIWIEAICMKHKYSIIQIEKLIDDFILHLKTQGGVKKSLKDNQSHFDYWLNKLPKENLPYTPKPRLIS